MSTLLDRLGGPDGLLAAVEILYKYVTEDERIASMFQGVHVMRLVKHQHMFLKHAFTTTDVDDADKMLRAHARLIRDKGLCCEHFDIMIGHLKQALRDVGVSEADIAEAEGTMSKYRARFPGGTIKGKGTELEPSFVATAVSA